MKRDTIASALAPASKTLSEHIDAFESKLIAHALDQTDGHQSKATELLGLRPNTLSFKIARYKLKNPTKDE